MGFMRTVGRLVVVAFAAAFLAILVLLVIGFVTGDISAKRIDTAVLALKGKLVSPRPEAKPETDLAERYKKEALKEAMRALEDLKKQNELALVTLNDRRSQIAKLEGEAVRVCKEISDATEALAEAEKAFEERKAAYGEALRSTGFKKATETFADMKKSIVAQIFYDYETTMAIELLKALDSDFRAKVIEEMQKLDQLPENSGEGKAAKYLKLICQGDAGLVTFKSE